MADLGLNTVTTGVKQGLNVKNLITTLVVVVVVIFILSYIMKQNVVLYDQNGNETGKGEVKFSFKKFKKPVTPLTPKE